MGMDAHSGAGELGRARHAEGDTRDVPEEGGLCGDGQKRQPRVRENGGARGVGVDHGRRLGLGVQYGAVHAALARRRASSGVSTPGSAPFLHDTTYLAVLELGDDGVTGRQLRRPPDGAARGIPCQGESPRQEPAGILQTCLLLQVFQPPTA